DGGSGGVSTYQISNTLGISSVTVNANGADIVNVGDPKSNLCNLTNLTVNGNGQTVVNIDDRGNGTIPTGYTSYTPLVTQYFLSAQQVVRDAQALALPSSVPQPVSFIESINYSNLASLGLLPGTGANIFNIAGSAAGTATSVTGNAGTSSSPSSNVYNF